MTAESVGAFAEISKALPITPYVKLVLVGNHIHICRNFRRTAENDSVVSRSALMLLMSVVGFPGHW